MNPGLELLRIYVKFLSKLSPADLKALESGRAGLALIHKKGRAMGLKSAEPTTAWLREK